MLSDTPGTPACFSDHALDADAQQSETAGARGVVSSAVSNATRGEGLNKHTTSNTQQPRLDCADTAHVTGALRKAQRLDLSAHPHGPTIPVTTETADHMSEGGSSVGLIIFREFVMLIA